MTISAWVPITISAAGASVSLLAFVYQARRVRFNQSVDLLFRLENDFFGPSRRAQRAKACHDLQRGSALESEPILDFFETMALLLRRGALDEEMVRHTFFYWINGYSQALSQHIAERQSREPLVWQDLTWMQRKLAKHKAKKLKLASLPRLSGEDISAFLREEQTEAPR